MLHHGGRSRRFNGSQASCLSMRPHVATQIVTERDLSRNGIRSIRRRLAVCRVLELRPYRQIRINDNWLVVSPATRVRPVRCHDSTVDYASLASTRATGVQLSAFGR